MSSALDRITPNLWFDGNAEEAAAFYVGPFPDSRIDKLARPGAAGPCTAKAAAVGARAVSAGRTAACGPCWKSTTAAERTLHSVDLLADSDGVDMLQKGGRLAVGQRPHVRHPRLAGLARLLVVPGVFAIRYDRVPVGNESFDDDAPVVAEFAEAHEYLLDDCLGTDVRAGQGKAVGLGPGNVIGKNGYDGCDIAGCETVIQALNNLFVGHRSTFVVFFAEDDNR